MKPGAVFNASYPAGSVAGKLASKLRATQAVLAIRERELLELKGPCSNTRCVLHLAHSGPCDVRESAI